MTLPLFAGLCEHSKHCCVAAAKRNVQDSSLGRNSRNSGRLLTSLFQNFDVLGTFCGRKYAHLDVIWNTGYHRFQPRPWHVTNEPTLHRPISIVTFSEYQWLAYDSLHIRRQYLVSRQFLDSFSRLGLEVILVIAARLAYLHCSVHCEARFFHAGSVKNLAISQNAPYTCVWISCNFPFKQSIVRKYRK